MNLTLYTLFNILLCRHDNVVIIAPLNRIFVLKMYDAMQLKVLIIVVINSKRQEKSASSGF